MSIVVLPGQFHSQPHPVGKLASTLLSVAVAGMADPARFRRGKTYVVERSVTRLEISPGRLVALVAGTRATPYQVIVATKTIDRPILGSPEAFRQHINHLSPEAGDLMVSCSCPDWDDPCKHAVAALLAFANELVVRPELLVEWRCKSGAEVAGGRAKVGSRAKPGERHLHVAPAPGTARARPTPDADTTEPAASGRPPRRAAPEPPAPWESPEWQRFLGGTPPSAPELPPDRAAAGRSMLGVLDLGEWVQSALEQLIGAD